MRYAMFAAALLLAACGDSSQRNDTVSANSNEALQANTVSNELIDNPNGTRTLRLEGNDTATFVDGELVDVNRAEE